MSITHNVVFLDETLEDDNFFCELCSFPLKTIEDFTSHRNNSCCQECFVSFAEARKEDWKEGWRPDKTSLEAYIYLRRSMFSN
jgi:hypothetical protein